MALGLVVGAAAAGGRADFFVGCGGEVGTAAAAELGAGRDGPAGEDGLTSTTLRGAFSWAAGDAEAAEGGAFDAAPDVAAVDAAFAGLGGRDDIGGG